ncbi:uncharacterized protein LOC117570635 isoform X1 [Drosophila albomicans]|uniref:Uncharacterized protein LOC117570635 isoform X1 n=1 Tax=Drosophila albomicans TaxID=7291 RepID=A0A9C6T661_DROAB|nr:uncharacterized protein LOC117570635 isoform X1 [Drosophila albomicans]
MVGGSKYKKKKKCEIKRCVLAAENGKWRTASSKQRATSGEWESGERRVESMRMVVEWHSSAQLS